MLLLFSTHGDPALVYSLTHFRNNYLQIDRFLSHFLLLQKSVDFTCLSTVSKWRCHFPDRLVQTLQSHVVTPSLLHTANAPVEQEVRSEHRQDGTSWGPGQTIRLIHEHSTGSQHLQGATAAVSAAAGGHQDNGQRGVEEVKPLPHLTQMNQETLQQNNGNFSCNNSITSC